MFACAMIGVTRLGYFSKGFMKNFLTKKHFGICLKTSLLNKKTCNWYTLGNFFCPITWSHWSVAWPVTHQGTLECKFKKVWLKIISKKNFFCCVTHLERWISVENTMEGENVTFTSNQKHSEMKHRRQHDQCDQIWRIFTTLPQH